MFLLPHQVHFSSICLYLLIWSGIYFAIPAPVPLNPVILFPVLWGWSFLVPGLMSWFPVFLCSHQGNLLSVTHTQSYHHKWFKDRPNGKSSPPPRCVQRGMLSHSFLRQIPPQQLSIHLSFSMMVETPHSQQRWSKRPLSLCVITADQWPISIYPWSVDLPERQPGSRHHSEGEGAKDEENEEMEKEGKVSKM